MMPDITPLSTTPSGSIVDVVLSAGVGVSVLVGIWRGFIKEILALIGWVVAYFCAQWWGVEAGKWIPIGETGSRLNALAGILLVFIATWTAWAFLTWAMREMLRATGLGGTDRLLGGAFGLLRGILIALVLYTMASMTPLTHWTPWQSAISLPWLNNILMSLQPMLPERMLIFLPNTKPDNLPDSCVGRACDKEVI